MPMPTWVGYTLLLLLNKTYPYLTKLASIALNLPGVSLAQPCWEPPLIKHLLKYVMPDYLFQNLLKLGEKYYGTANLTHVLTRGIRRARTQVHLSQRHGEMNLAWVLVTICLVFLVCHLLRVYLAIQVIFVTSSLLYPRPF